MKSQDIRTQLICIALSAATIVGGWAVGAALADSTQPPAQQTPAQQTMSQQDYLRRLSENISNGGKSPSNADSSNSSTVSSDSDKGFSSVDGKYLLAASAAILGVIGLGFWWQNRSAQPKRVKHVNYSRKLFKQVGKQMGLASDEMKQLKVLADVHEREKGQPLENPLTLLLCPSLLTQSMEVGDVKIDRQVIARMAKRISQKQKTA